MTTDCKHLQHKKSTNKIHKQLYNITTSYKMLQVHTSTVLSAKKTASLWRLISPIANVWRSRNIEVQSIQNLQGDQEMLLALKQSIADRNLPTLACGWSDSRNRSNVQKHANTENSSGLSLLLENLFDWDIVLTWTSGHDVGTCWFEFVKCTA